MEERQGTLTAGTDGWGVGRGVPLDFVEHVTGDATGILAVAAAEAGEMGRGDFFIMGGIACSPVWDGWLTLHRAERRDVCEFDCSSWSLWEYARPRIRYLSAPASFGAEQCPTVRDALCSDPLSGSEGTAGCFVTLDLRRRDTTSVALWSGQECGAGAE